MVKVTATYNVLFIAGYGAAKVILSVQPYSMKIPANTSFMVETYFERRKVAAVEKKWESSRILIDEWYRVTGLSFLGSITLQVTTMLVKYSNLSPACTLSYYDTFCMRVMRKKQNQMRHRQEDRIHSYFELVVAVR